MPILDEGRAAVAAPDGSEEHVVRHRLRAENESRTDGGTRIDPRGVVAAIANPDVANFIRLSNTTTNFCQEAGLHVPGYAFPLSESTVGTISATISLGSAYVFHLRFSNPYAKVGAYILAI